MQHLLSASYISTADIRADVYRTEEGDRCRLHHDKLELEWDCELAELRRQMTEVTGVVLERIAADVDTAASISPEVGRAITELHATSPDELEQLLSAKRPEVVLLAMFEYGRRGLESPVARVYDNAEAMQSSLVRARVHTD